MLIHPPPYEAHTHQHPYSAAVVVKLPNRFGRGKYRDAIQGGGTYLLVLLYTFVAKLSVSYTVNPLGGVYFVPETTNCGEVSALQLLAKLISCRGTFSGD